MAILFVAIHIIVCILLIVIILIQSGRGGGLVDGLSGVESMFGPKTNVFLTRTTTVLAILFFLTCISLAVLSARQSRSLMRDIKQTTTQTSTGQQEPKISQEQAEAEKTNTPMQQQAP
ncbi:MAG: preprotein translocase subunit SecG [Candidatus Omnitrophica bacterium]|nr:preprotein translocase subunit SecG [Candidatus Omnitrophota bacterium]